MSDASPPPNAPRGPLPEHAKLSLMAGTWNAEMTFPPGAPFPPMSGTQINTIGCGGLWLVMDLQVKNQDGMPYVGHGITGYDPVKKAYVQTWVDGWSPVMSHVQAHFNAAGNLLTWAGETHDAATGRRTPLKMTTEFQGADVHVFTMYGADPSGQEFAMMTITYRRKK